MGENIIRMGDHGKGLETKILHNALVGQIQNGVNEVLSMAKKLDLDLNDVCKAFGYGGAQCFYLDSKKDNIINDNYPTAFSVENMNKDIHFAIDIANNLSLSVPSLRNVCKIYEKAMELNFQKEDFSISYKVVEANYNEKN